MRKNAKNAQFPTQEALRERVGIYMQEEGKLLAKHGLAKRIVMTFPAHSKVPLLGRFGLWLLKRSKGVIDTEFGAMLVQK